jgi:hypothetical protein
MGGWRVVVMEDADRMTESAANAYLKQLKNPALAPFGYFAHQHFTTSCQRFARAVATCNCAHHQHMM